MRICFWSTTFQSDNHALAHYLAGQSDFEVTVAMAEPERFRQEAVLKLLPFAGRLVSRDDSNTKRMLLDESFDCVVIDNHVPAFPIAPRAHVLWHGFVKSRPQFHQAFATVQTFSYFVLILIFVTPLGRIFYSATVLPAYRALSTLAQMPVYLL